MSEKIELRNCPDCDVKPGEIHLDNCDVERCPECGGQLLSCGCESERPRLKWTGVWPGVLECREFGWYSFFDPTKGWVRCQKGDSGASEDLNRLYEDAVWDKKRGRFVVKQDTQDAAAGMVDKFINEKD